MLTIKPGTIEDVDDGIIMPSIKYETYKRIIPEKAYEGKVIPIPAVLIEYLSHTELIVFAMTLDQIRTGTVSAKKMTDISERAGVSQISISKASTNLVKMGILGKAPKSKKMREIKFDNIKTLENVLKNRTPGTAKALRAKIGLRDISTLTEPQLRWLDMFGGCEDEVENEEYK